MCCWAFQGEFTPHHQPQDSEYWVYPSEQQYYNAMKVRRWRIKQVFRVMECVVAHTCCCASVLVLSQQKKGYSPEERDMSVILAIHNLVNEQGWSKIKEWEREKGCENPKLLRFMGRPKDISPKARLRSLIG